MIDNPKMQYVIVDGIEYGMTWQDRGNHMHLKLFKDGKFLCFKNHGLMVDDGYGVLRWIVRARLMGVRFKNEFNNTKA
jgi:hypothetical protein